MLRIGTRAVRVPAYYVARVTGADERSRRRRRERSPRDPRGRTKRGGRRPADSRHSIERAVRRVRIDCARGSAAIGSGSAAVETATTIEVRGGTVDRSRGQWHGRPVELGPILAVGRLKRGLAVWSNRPAHLRQRLHGDSASVSTDWRWVRGVTTNRRVTFRGATPACRWIHDRSLAASADRSRRGAR